MSFVRFVGELPDLLVRQVGLMYPVSRTEENNNNMDYDTQYATEEANYDEMINMLTFEDRFPVEESTKCKELKYCSGAWHDEDCPKFEDVSNSETGYAY